MSLSLRIREYRRSRLGRGRWSRAAVVGPLDAMHARPIRKGCTVAESQKTILIVEDSPVQATSIGHLLLQHGARVLYAPDGRAGLSIAQRYLPDAIILDLEMPRMNGLETCKRLKADPETADIPVVLLTRYADRHGLTSGGSKAGTVDFIPKDGLTNTVLVETLRQLCILESPGH